MKFDSGEWFCTSTNSAAATASFTLTAATRGIFVESLAAYSDLSGAVATIQASGTTLWAMALGSACVPVNFAGLKIDNCQNGAASSLSCLITASSIGAYVAMCGRFVSL